MKHIVIFDLDGTLADQSKRTHLVAHKPKDWDKFYAECVNDTVVEDVAHLCNIMHLAGRRVVILTGRSDRVITETIDWLKTNDIRYHDLIMRPEGNHVPDYIWKKRMVDLYEFTPEKVIFIVEDRKRVVDMWRSNGYTCMQVAEGDF